MFTQRLEASRVWQRRLLSLSLSLSSRRLIILASLFSFPILSSSGLAAPLDTFKNQSFQADLFTGSAGAEIPIIVPPGAAGVAPKVTLRYNSGVVDDIEWNDQADWTGLGWYLDTGGFVVRDTKGTTAISDDTFKLVFGGDTHDLISIGGSSYRTKDETFLQVTFNSGSDYWIVKTKDGTTHRFG